MKDSKIGIIHEIGDIGLGFDELSEKDQKALEEAKKEQEKPSK